MDKQTLVIKLGGALIENDEALTALFATLKTFLDDQHRPLVLVHGGGCLVDDLLKGLGLTSTKKNGLRVTPFEQIPFIAGALAGTANKQMMAKAIATGIPAVGLCLADGGLCQVTQLDPDLGAVGECKPGNPALVAGILGQGFLPVVSSIGITADGQLMNVNADQAATAIAEALGADLVMLSDVSGIL
ncbi:MAG: acetylglutamate kinase, partial [Aeromonas sobria]